MIEAGQLMLDIEALIFASEQPLPLISILDYLNQVYEEEIDQEAAQQAIEAIEEKYKAVHYPFEVVRIGNGFQFLSKKKFHPLIAHLNGEKYNKKLSATAMETLSIIAYRQPITKGDIEYIRGVSADYAIQKLLDKELITIIGRDEEAVGKPLLYATTNDFFDYLGINSSNDLPNLKEFAAQMTLPTDAAQATPQDQIEEISEIVIDENGNINLD